jgi:uncharacterized protein (TIGR02217 family)
MRIGTGDGAIRTFALSKTYGVGPAPYRRAIAKPVAGTVLVAVGGASVAASVDVVSGLVELDAAPAPGLPVTAGFEFDVPVRFDTDELAIDLTAFEAGRIPTIPLIEIVP